MGVTIRMITQSRWLDTPPWLPAGGVPADSITDLKTSGNVLSLFVLPSDDDTALLRLAAAMVAKRDRLGHFEYFEFLESELLRLTLKVVQSRGDTCDDVVNTWHVNLVELDGNRLLALTGFLRSLKAGRLFKPEVAAEIAVGVKQGRFSREPKCIDEMRKNGLL